MRGMQLQKVWVSLSDIAQRPLDIQAKLRGIIRLLVCPRATYSENTVWRAYENELRLAVPSCHGEVFNG